MMAKKYYAVKIGKNTGIFQTWEECKENVDGYPGALYKSFKTISEAYTYLGDEGTQMSLFDMDAVTQPTNTTKTEIPDETMPISTASKAIAYVDGSFNAETNVFGYGVVMFHNGKEIHLSHSYNDEDLATMRNVAGEIYGSMAAMTYALENNIKTLSIYYDYMGIAKWCTGEWKTNKNGTIAYKKYYDKARKKVNINFEKVKGHSGDKYNDLADKLAKEACGIE
ncbi:viroplasmin family protein [uncultured Eubacterium sp.]|uniref:ribonuclease H1 domain-containing protein n=1 Tax=uncultured Eubacterium sp. TaxID=165185 RepID=UPI0034A0B92A